MTSQRKKKAKRGNAAPGRAPDARRGGTGGPIARWLTSPRRAALVVFLFAVLLYANTLGHAFVWDDHDLIVENPLVRTLDRATIVQIFTTDFWRAVRPGGAYYRPLVTLSYHVNYAVFDGNPAGFHLVNVLWNAGACVLAFVFVHLLFGDVVLALVTALLFAANPIHSEAVAWISGRTDVLAALWAFASLSCYVLARRRGSRPLVVASLAAFLLAMLAKETAACVPFLVVLLEAGPFGRLLPREAAPGAGLRWRLIARAALFFGVLALYLVLRHEALGTASTTYQGFAPGAVGRVALPLSIFAGYVYKALLPLRLSAEYDAPIPTSFADPSVLAGAAVLIGTLWAVWRWRHRPDIVLGTGIFVFALAPVLNIIPIGEVSAERFLYIPSLGIALLLGSLFASALATRIPALRRGALRWNLSQSTAGFAIVLWAIVMIVFTGRTFARNFDWQSDAVLFAKTAAQEPDNPRTCAALAQEAEARGDLAGAIRNYQKSISLNPNYTVALNGLAGVYARQGRYDEALPLVERAVALAPEDPKMLSNLGSLYYETKDYAKAARQFEKALALNPDELRAHFNLGLALLAEDDRESALPHFERAAEGGAGFALAYYHLAVIEQALGNTERAKEHARRFLTLYSRNDQLRQEVEALVRGSRVTPARGDSLGEPGHPDTDVP